MVDKEACIPICYAFIALILAVAALSWMVNENNTGRWMNTIEESTRGSYYVVGNLIRSWEQKPFVDVIVTDDAFCPDDFKEDLVFDTWLGTRAMCDCLQRGQNNGDLKDGGRQYYLDQLCERGNKQRHQSSDCYDVGSLAPVVQNRINGARYCGSQGQKSLFEMQRPIPINDTTASNGRKYKCPDGFFACNEEWLDEPGSEDYVVCRSSQEELCPITSIKFEVTESERIKYDYQQRGIDSTRSIWFSRKVKAHGIEQIKLHPNQPCADKVSYNANQNQQFYFAELQRDDRTCSTIGQMQAEDSSYQEMTTTSSNLSSLWQIQKDNGVIDYLDQARSLTYSFWPSQEIKKQTPMKFYQKNIYNYKLECDHTEGKRLSDFRELMTIDDRGSNWQEMINFFKDIAVTFLVLMLVLPLCTFQASLFATPCVMIATAGVFIKVLVLSMAAIDEVDAMANQMTTPEWINDCLEPQQQLDLDYIAQNQENLRSLSSDLSGFSAIMIIFCVQVFLPLFILCCALCTKPFRQGDCDCADLFTDFSWLMTKGYTLFN